MSLEKREMTIHNARLLDGAERRTIARNGFELLTRRLANPGLDFLHHDQVVQEYYRECAQVVRKATGAPNVFAFDHTSGRLLARRVSNE